VLADPELDAALAGLDLGGAPPASHAAAAHDDDDIEIEIDIDVDE
jgi:hypothetical protein